jgi:hypothetical protein
MYAEKGGLDKVKTVCDKIIPRPVKPNPSHEGEGRTVWYSAYRFSLSGCGIIGSF